MANTSAVYARIDSGVKKNAEEIMERLGVTPSSAIQMLYSQIVLTGGLPFTVRLPAQKPNFVSGVTREELDAQLSEGLESLRSGSCTADEVDAALGKEFGL